jgi:CDP-4-dehydro-6-deoxyglucose reductase
LFPPKENIYFQVVDRVQRTPRIIELRLRPLGAPMRFWPGQFVMVGDERNGIPMRSYSIANIPNADGEICLMITKVDEGMTSGWIHENLQPGTRVMINGPYGTFIGDPSVDKPVMCMAAGSGLAPILSLTGAALARGYKAPVTLIFSAQHQEDMMYRGLLEFWASKYRNFKWYCTYTQDDSAELRGRIPTILKDISQDLSEHGVYIAGGPGFVEDCSAKAMALGADKDQIHTEGFFDQFVPERPPKERLMG